jgi:micrococcal nuclease
MEYIFEYSNAFLVFLLMVFGSLFNSNVSNEVTSIEPGATTTATVLSVIDGDTIDVIIEGNKDSVRVRYIGIDTPEPYATKVPECGSSEATARNKQLVENKVVSLVRGADPYDDYERLLAYVYVDDEFVNETLVREGFAQVMMIKPNIQFKSNFTSLYTQAREQKIGIWSVCK